MATLDPKSSLEQAIDERLLLCPICKERMVNPKLLPCVHTFCEKCLDRWVTQKEGILECPTCRHVSPLPAKGIVGLSTNLFIVDLIEILDILRPGTGVRYCDVCGKKATCWCTDCSQFFCTGCRLPHEKARATKNHSLLTTEEYNNMAKFDRDHITRTRFCGVHESSPIELFCEHCQSTVCMKCAVTAHKGTAHKLLSLEDALEKYIPEVRATINGLSSRVQSLHEKKQEKEQAIKECNKKHSKKGRQKLKELHAQIDQIEFDLGCINSISEYASKLLQHGNAADVLDQKNGLEKRLIKIGGLHPPFRSGTPYTESPANGEKSCNMPEGTMNVTDCDSYSRIDYVFGDGIQGPEHPNPGQPYRGCNFTGFILNDAEGREVLRLLRIAFDRRLTFTINKLSNEVVWNGITHIQYLIFNDSYREPYLRRVRDELAARGVV